MTSLPFDIRTVIFLLCVGNLAAVAILLAYRSTATMERPYRQFLAGKLLQALAWPLLGLRGEIDDLLSIEIGNTILIAGFAMEALAITVIDKPARRWGIVYPLLGTLGILAFWIFADTPNRRVGLASLATVVLFGTAAIVLLRHSADSRLRRVIGALYALFSLILVARAGVALTAPAEFGLLSPHLVQVMAFLPVYLIMLVGGIGFLLLLKEQDDALLHAANRELDRMSRVDGLTSLANRRYFDETLNRAIRDSRRRGEPLTLIMMDVDLFKPYNDVLGHVAGDDCLRAIGRLLLQWCKRPRDVAARYGGEEFAMILPNTDPAAGAAIAERIREEMMALGIAHPASSVSDRVTLSMGVFTAVPTREAEDETWYISGADRRLYAAKQAGRNRVVGA
jgi:diguanylate cyclase (GGDEF)-like protein